MKSFVYINNFLSKTWKHTKKYNKGTEFLMIIIHDKEFFIAKIEITIPISLKYLLPSFLEPIRNIITQQNEKMLVRNFHIYKR